MKAKYIPNILSIMRIIMAFVFVALWARDYFGIAVIVFIVAGITDVVDGILARRFGWITNAGKILDPLADKLMQVVALLCLFLSNFDKAGNAPLVPWWLLLPIVLKEIIMGIGSIVFYKKFKTIGVSKNYGKAYTVLFYVVIAAIIVFDAWFITHIWVKYILCALTAASGWVAIVLYYITYLKGTFKKKGTAKKKD